MEKRKTQCIGDRLCKSLRELAKLKGRHVQDQALYLVEVMAAVADKQPDFRLEPEVVERVNPNVGLKLEFSEWLDDKLFHMAGSYGLSKQQLVRALLWMGIRFYRELAPRGKILRKEEFVELVLEKYRPTLIN